MKLTKQNYFTKENQYISNSKLKNWLKDKNYFYRKHILCELSDTETQPLRLGHAIDCWLTEGKEVFDKKYIAVSRRNLKNPPKNYIELSNGEYETVCNICKIAEKQDAYKDLKNYTAQEILQDDDLQICGIPDWYYYDKKTKQCIIVDLKTTQSINPIKYHYQSLDLNYYTAQAFYQILLKKKYPDIKEFISKHFVIEKDTEKTYPCQTFILNQERIELEKNFILEEIKKIKKEKDFAPKNIGWEDSIEIGEIKEIENEII